MPFNNLGSLDRKDLTVSGKPDTATKPLETLHVPASQRLITSKHTFTEQQHLPKELCQEEDMDQQQLPGVAGPAGRRLHIAHRRNPSDMTPLLSRFYPVPVLIQVYECVKRGPADTQ